MTIQIPRQLPLALPKAEKTDVRTQFGALAYRMRAGKLQILLITSRGSGRWIVPKGWPMSGVRPSEAAMTEAWEEAGVIGKAHDICLGVFSYRKTGEVLTAPCAVLLYPVEVKKLARKFPERAERRRKWFTAAKAASKVSEPELAKLIATFDPRSLRSGLKT